jgi:hypothetical protein
VALWLLLPVVSLSQWTRHADEVKSRSAIGYHLRSNDPVILAHGYGGFAQRLKRDTWGVLVSRTIPDITGRITGALLPMIGLALTRCPRMRYLICIALFLLPFLLFTNLHRAQLLEGALEGSLGQRSIAYGILMACVAVSVFGYFWPGTRYDYPFDAGGGFRGYYHERPQTIATQRDSARLCRRRRLLIASWWIWEWIGRPSSPSTPIAAR